MGHLTGAIRQDYAQRILYWSQDESRIGLLTEQGKCITAKGVKPKGVVQWSFQYCWSYGAVYPQLGTSFFWEFTHLNGICFSYFLEQLSQQYPDHFHVIQVDHARAHLAKSVRIPSNIKLLFQPPYCPELNVIKRVWQELKRKMQWHWFEDIEALQQQCSEWINSLSKDVISSLTQ